VSWHGGKSVLQGRVERGNLEDAERSGHLSGVTMVLQWRHSGVTEALQCCYSSVQ
jgi:hypothetical protein